MQLIAYFDYNIYMNTVKKNLGYFAILRKYVKPFKKDTILGVLFTSLESFLELFVPFLMNFLLTYSVSFDETIGKYTLHVNYLILISATMIVFAGLAFAFGFTSAKYIARSVRSFGAELRNATFRKIIELSFEDIDKFRQSSLITRLTDDNQIIQNNFSDIFRPIVRAPIQLIFCVTFSIIIIHSYQ